MLRLTAILTLVFYITVSIGVHVDVDTCCDSIAGVSMMSDSEQHLVADSDCCASIEDSCCSPSEEKACSLDCIFIQILAEEQIASSNEGLRFAEQIQFPSLDLLLLNRQDSKELSETMEFTNPPLISMEDAIYMVNSSFITYG